MKIKDLKEKLNAGTSEELFGINKQPSNSCPRIDKWLKFWNNSRRDIFNYCKYIRNSDTVEEAINISYDIDSEISNLDIESEYEELRKQCEDIRAWGQGWKDLAKILIEQNNSDLSDFMSDKFYLKLTNDNEQNT